MAMSAGHKLKFEALYQQWWRLHMSESSRVGRKATHKQTENYSLLIIYIINVFYCIR